MLIRAAIQEPARMLHLLMLEVCKRLWQAIVLNLGPNLQALSRWAAK